MTLPGWTREPLVHFLVAGALLYAFFALSGGNAVDPSSRVIEIGREEQAQLAVQFERTMGRAPTDAELDVLIERHVRDEVLYREALRLGLDQNDAVVRRRMVSKMDMTAAAAAEVAQPSEAELRDFFEKNAERYSGGELVSFEQAYFSSEDAAEAALQSGTVRGEPISLPRTAKAMRLQEVKSRFGDQFAGSLSAIEPGDEWRGPVRSGFGWHLVRVTARDAVAGDFKASRDRIENDWRSAEIEARKDRAFEILREAYRIEIDR